MEQSKTQMRLEALEPATMVTSVIWVVTWLVSMFLGDVLPARGVTIRKTIITSVSKL